MSHDLDEAKREIERLNLALEQARSELQEFSYSVSHDLRASLRHVTAYVQIIREDLGTHADKGVSASLETVTVAARHMGQLIDGLMEMSRIGQIGLAPAPVDTASLLAEIRASLKGEEVGREVIWRVADDFPAVRGDAALLRQVWSRLLSNALKYTRSRAVAHIDISWAAAGDGFCAFHVKDNGVGFNPRFKEKLFRVFQRLHSASEFEGTGMGLALTRRIVERHGGAVWAEGDVDAGCNIGFTLPLLDADVKP